MKKKTILYKKLDNILEEKKKKKIKLNEIFKKKEAKQNKKTLKN